MALKDTNQLVPSNSMMSSAFATKLLLFVPFHAIAGSKLSALPISCKIKYRVPATTFKNVESTGMLNGSMMALIGGKL